MLVCEPEYFLNFPKTEMVIIQKLLKWSFPKTTLVIIYISDFQSWLTVTVTCNLLKHTNARAPA